MNIHLDRYKQQIVNEAWFPAGDPQDTAHLHPEVDTYGICESIADEIGDDTLEQLVAFLADADSRSLTKFCKELYQVVNGEHGYRNQRMEDDRAEFGS
jgi:hypothetical protein